MGGSHRISRWRALCIGLLAAGGTLISAVSWADTRSDDASPAIVNGQAQTTPTQPSEPVTGKIALTLHRTYRAAGRTVTLAGRRFRLSGLVTPYVPKQYVVVRFYRHGKKLRAVKLKVHAVRGTDDGSFRTSFRSGRAGKLVVRASHRVTQAQTTMVARPVVVNFLRRRMSVGSNGLAVRVLQRQLARLHYAVSGAGYFDDATARAVTAYRKVTGMSRTTDVNSRIMLRLLRGKGRFKVRYPGHGRHVEADLSRQVLALTNGRKVHRIYPISSGSPATPTVQGHFRVYMKSPGTNAKGMVHSSYFIRGYAVHGYASIPPYPASHGCLRVPVPNALAIFHWIRVGTPVDVYP